MADNTTTEQNVERVLVELCQLFPVRYVEISMKANRNGTSWVVYVRGERGFHGSTLDEAMTDLRQWHAEQAKES